MCACVCVVFCVRVDADTRAYLVWVLRIISLMDHLLYSILSLIITVICPLFSEKITQKHVFQAIVGGIAFNHSFKTGPGQPVWPVQQKLATHPIRFSYRIQL